MMVGVCLLVEVFHIPYGYCQCHKYTLVFCCWLDAIHSVAVVEVADRWDNAQIQQQQQQQRKVVVANYIIKSVHGPMHKQYI